MNSIVCGLNEIMAAYLEEFNSFKTTRTQSGGFWDTFIDWTSINHDLKTKPDSIYTKYVDEFSNILSRASVEDLDKMFKKMKTTSPTVLFADIKKYYKQCCKTALPAKPTFEEKVKFLTYAFVVEVYVQDYVGRMNERVLDALL